MSRRRKLSLRAASRSQLARSWRSSDWMPGDKLRRIAGGYLSSPRARKQLLACADKIDERVRTFYALQGLRLRRYRMTPRQEREARLYVSQA